MEGKYRVKDGCLTVAMPKELDHHSALGLKAETDMLIGAYPVSYTHLTLPTKLEV